MSLGLFLSCSNVQHSDYERNLEITKEWFDTFGNEDLEVTMSYFADEIEYQSAFYGGPLMNKAETTEYYKGWHDAMEGITYEAQNYLPGVDPDTGLLNGSVRTYGTWTGKNSITGKDLNLKGYWYFNFDDEGKVITQGDFFDIGGMMQAVGPKTPVLVQLKVKPGKKQAMIDLLNTPDGLQATRDYDGCMSLEAFFNDDTNTYYVYGNWASYEHYQKYLDWRFNEDESKLAQQVVALCVGGEKGLTPLFPNSDYASF